jgi:serine/threonine-protein kinase
VLPITGLNSPEGVAVDTAGTVYIADNGNNRVVKLPAG